MPYAAITLNTVLASVHTQMTYGATRQQQVIVKTPAKWSAHLIPTVLLFLVLVFKV
jgi:hypothetical protein